MELARRQTVIAHGRLAMRDLCMAAAREHRHGLQIPTFEQLAARLAGGMTRPVDVGGEHPVREQVVAHVPPDIEPVA